MSLERAQQLANVLARMGLPYVFMVENAYPYSAATDEWYLSVHKRTDKRAGGAYVLEVYRVLECETDTLDWLQGRSQ